jgi:hypothetical protein
MAATSDRHAARLAIPSASEPIAESVLTMSLGVESQRRSEHPDLFGSHAAVFSRRRQ